MDQEEILQQVTGVRARVAEAMTQIEQKRDATQAVLTSAQERIQQLQAEFNSFQAHLKSEAARAATAAEELVDGLHTAGTTLGQAAQARRDAGADFQSGLSDQKAALDDDSEGLRELQSKVREQAEQRRVLRADLEQQLQEKGAAHGEGVSEHVVTASADRRQSADEVGGEQNDRVQALMDDTLANARQAFAELLDSRASQARERLNVATEQLQAHTGEEVQRAISEENNAREELSQCLDAMRKALDGLSTLATECGETMIRGADDASDLMNATNVGARTVIGLFNNVREIFDEIESAWA